MAKQELTTSVGVVLEVYNPPAMALRDKQRQLEKAKPKVPVVYLESKGREEENPNDPDYIQAMNDFNEQLGLELYNAAVLLCVKVKMVPAGVTECDDDSWVEDFEVIGMPIPNGRARYLAWIKYIAAPAASDMAAIENAITRAAGVAEEDVAEAAASFPSEPPRVPYN